MRYLTTLICMFFLAVASASAADIGALLAKANAGDADAQYKLGTMYNTGENVPRDPDQAFAWFSKAAHQGHAGAMHNLAVAYYNGNTLGGSVPTDIEQAWVWFTLAAENGDSASKADAERVWSELRDMGQEGARIKLADMYAKGDGVPVNGPRAVEVLRSVPGSREAQLKLAQIYLDGILVPRDLAAARQQCEPMAQMKQSAGYYCMGLIAERSEPANAIEAAKFYEKAARIGDPRAMFRLASSYAAGTGVQQDAFKAYMWSYIGASLDFAPARGLMASLETKLTPKEIEKAQKEATKYNRFVARKPSRR